MFVYSYLPKIHCDVKALAVSVLHVAAYENCFTRNQVFPS
jgi:hypothetical protein